MQARVQVDVGQILTLLGCEDFSRATHAGHSIQLFVRAPIEEEARMNVRYWVVRSTGQCNTACSLSAGVWKPKVFRGR